MFDASRRHQERYGLFKVNNFHSWSWCKASNGCVIYVVKIEGVPGVSPSAVAKTRNSLTDSHNDWPNKDVYEDEDVSQQKKLVNNAQAVYVTEVVRPPGVFGVLNDSCTPTHHSAMKPRVTT